MEGSSVRNPSDLQIYYQRNLFYALLITILCALFSAGYLAFLKPNINQPVSIIPANLIFHDNEPASQSEPIQAKHLLREFNPYNSQHNGFLGFVDIEIDQYVSQPIISSRPVPEVENISISSDDMIFSFSIIEGDDTGIYFPSEGDLTFASRFSGIDYDPISREVQVIHDVEPEYPWVANDAGKEGEVIFLVYIDSLGNLSSFQDRVSGDDIEMFQYMDNGNIRDASFAYREEPQGWYFAQNFIKVLPEWKFSPKIVHGKPVGSFLRIKQYYCLGLNCMRFELNKLIPVIE